ncbi:MAG: exonuclease SbcCD subunit D [Christensenella sp.]
MRILHTSDWHLGVTLGSTSLLEEQRYFLEQLYKTAEKVDAVVIAGDIFDHAVSNADAIALYNEAMTVLCIDLDVPVMICAGNHDGAARLSSCGRLLERAGLFIAGGVRDGVKKVDTADTVFHLLPYFSIDEVRYLYPDEEIKSYDAAMRAVIKHIEKSTNKNNVLAAHCFAAGAEPSESDRSAMVGGANKVGTDVFAGFDYVALGHLHRAQNVGKNVRYSGTPIKLAFNEAGAVKSMTIIDTKDFSREEIPIYMKHDLRVISGKYSELLSTAQNDPHKDDYIKIELEDEYAHREIFDTFQNFYPRLMFIAGKQMGNMETTLSIEEASSLDPEDLMAAFYHECTNEQPSKKQTEWFKKALMVQQNGGDAQ